MLYWTPRGDFLDLGGLKPGFGWVIRLKSTSTLAPNVYNNCSIRGTVYLLSDVLDTKGRVWEGVSVGTFFGFGGINTRFWVGYKA